MAALLLLVGATNCNAGKKWLRKFLMKGRTNLAIIAYLFQKNTRNEVSVCNNLQLKRVYLVLFLTGVKQKLWVNVEGETREFSEE